MGHTFQVELTADEGYTFIPASFQLQTAGTVFTATKNLCDEDEHNSCCMQSSRGVIIDSRQKYHENRLFCLGTKTSCSWQIVSVQATSASKKSTCWWTAAMKSLAEHQRQLESASRLLHTAGCRWSCHACRLLHPVPLITCLSCGLEPCWQHCEGLIYGKRNSFPEVPGKRIQHMKDCM